MKVRATLVELWNRITPFNTEENVYFNGENNLYPNEMERVVVNSPTASMGAELLSKYILGYGDVENPLINGVRKNDIIKDITDDISIQNGSFIHITYGIEVVASDFNIIPIGLKVLDYAKCRKLKNDDNHNSGMIKYKDFEDKSMWGNTDEVLYYPYSNDKKVIIEQIKRDNKDRLKKNPELTIAEMLPNYKGQVFYLNLTPRYEYAISKFNAVYNDCDTEYRMSVYSNVNTRGGFLGKLAVLITGLDDETSETIKEDVGNWLGSENSSDAYFLEIENVENLDDCFKIINVPTNYNEAQFKETKTDVRRNILAACNSLPEALVFNTDNGVFGNSGELIKQMRIIFTEATEYERMKVEETLTSLGFPTKLITFIKEDDTAIKE